MDQSIAGEIKKILYGYVAAQSISNSSSEKNAEEFFLSYFSEVPYFQQHPEHYGAYAIPDDGYHRCAVWAMRKGEGKDTIVLIHHYDVVTVEDFKLLKDYAFSPDLLEEKLWKIKDTLAREAREDLESGGYLFGRGVCDMKGGGAIQMALLRAYCAEESFRGNVIVLGVPDEENLSAGMRAGVELLVELKKTYDLHYRLMINSEPHQRKEKDTGVFSFGSIGKVMPYVYVRGCLAHAGKVFEGLNPTNIMCEIVRRTEVNMDLSDVVGKEAAPPPTWLYLRENKLSYDVSMPLTINGCLSVLTLNQSPGEVMERLKQICEAAFDQVIDEMNASYTRFLRATGQPMQSLPWRSKVVTFGELCAEAEKSHGADFTEAYGRKLQKLKEQIAAEEESLIMANFKLVDFVYDYIDDLSPRVVIGLMPPYYPNVSNVTRAEKYDETINSMYTWLCDFVAETYGQAYSKEDFYTGISDLSYSSMDDSEAIRDSLNAFMPFFGSIYTLPLESIEEISMPCVNIGPWGKDFHKLTERVNKEDLYERTPTILNYAIRHILQGQV